MPSDQHPVEIRAEKRTAAQRVLVAYLAIIAGALCVLAALTTAAAAAAPLPQSAGEGRAIFEEKCAGCHSTGAERLVGPGLQDVTIRRDPQWLRDFITDPAGMIARDANAKKLYEEYNNYAMPAVPLTEAELEAVLAFLADPSAAPPAAPGESAAGGGDPAAGQRLFTGETPLQNGGVACMACHSVSGTGALGGGALGPDLTNVVSRMGEAGVAASLRNIVFPTMIGPFQNRPLTEQEQADLVAFLRDADRRRPPAPAVAAGSLTPNLLLMAALGLAGAGLLFGVLLFFWLRRSGPARLPARKVKPANRRTLPEQRMNPRRSA